MVTTNRQVRLKSRPVGIPQAEHFEVATADLPPLGERQIRVRNVFLSVEPAMRGWVNAAANYQEPVAIGAVMRAFAAGKIVESNDPAWKPGEHVMGMLGWQDYATIERDAIERRVSPDMLAQSLGVLGLNGLTAYFGVLDLAEPKPGETFLVSTAAGAVGSCAAQIARLAGCRTVGITGGPEKRRQCLEEFGFDAAIDYKNTKDMAAAVAAACPDGVNIYFDNTSGPISDAVMPQLAQKARVIVCGTASIANWDPAPPGPRVDRYLLTKSARMIGLLVPTYKAQWPAAAKVLERWVRDGKIRYRQQVLEGIEQAPDAIARLYRGENSGKLLIRIADPDA